MPFHRTKFLAQRAGSIAGLLVVLGCSSVSGVDDKHRVAPLDASGTEGNHAVSAALALTDQFTTFSSSNWYKSTYVTPTGNGYFRSANVSVVSGNLQLTLPAGTYDGGQVETLQSFGYGTYSAIMKCSPAAGTMCTVFSYSNSSKDEIDIEIYKGSSWRIDFVIWRKGSPQRLCSGGYQPSFDPSAGYHIYEYSYRPNEIRFLVDGALRHSCRTISSIPTTSMKLLLSAWQPKWLNKPPATSTTSVKVTAVTYQP